MEIVIYIIVTFFCCFLLYYFSKQDFVLLRQNISLSQIFDALSVSTLSAFLMGRALYVVNNLKSDLLSFLRFFHIWKYPGISMFGFLGGGGLCLFLIFAKKKGLSRICDIFTISFFPLFAVSIFFEKYMHGLIFLPILMFIVAVAFFIFFLRSHHKYILRDGSISLIFLLLLALETIASQYFSGVKNSIFMSLSILEMLCIIIVPASLVGLVINQRKK
ncbi:MAG TPA: hypothetical protein VG965_06635 [Patescibacteria group bacterium]|nr:hypothetical protein [Patescibacteria group bacterium]